jgi:hypothetical protein
VTDPENIFNCFGFMGLGGIFGYCDSRFCWEAVYSRVVIEETRQYSGWDRNRPEAGGELRVKRAVPDAVEFARTRLGVEPDEKQAEVLRSEAKRGMLNCTRQWGKSTIAAAKAVHRAYTRPKSLVLVASPSYRQSGEFVAMLDIEVCGDGDNDVSLAFPNGSRIVGLPGVEGTVRGFSAVSMLW